MRRQRRRVVIDTASSMVEADLAVIDAEIERMLRRGTRVALVLCESEARSPRRMAVGDRAMNRTYDLPQRYPRPVNAMADQVWPSVSFIAGRTAPSPQA